MREQSNPAGTRGSVEWKMTFGFCCACAENAPKPSTVKKAPARQTSKPIKTRRLRNPPSPKLRRVRTDCEVELFFMVVDFHQTPGFLIEIPMTIKTLFWAS